MRMFSFTRLQLILWGLICAMALSACGFQMRGMQNMAFENLYIQGNLSISKALKKSLAVNGVKIVSDPEQAQLMLELMGESSEKRILSLSGTGVVREFELYYRVHFRMRDPASETWGEVQMVEGRRDYSYTDAELLAKSFEEIRLNDEMHADAVREIMRRLIVQKPSKSKSTG